MYYGHAKKAFMDDNFEICLGYSVLFDRSLVLDKTLRYVSFSFSAMEMDTIFSNGKSKHG